MTDYQRAKRITTWQIFGGGLLAIAGMVIWMMSGGIAP